MVSSPRESMLSPLSDDSASELFNVDTNSSVGTAAEDASCECEAEPAGVEDAGVGGLSILTADFFELVNEVVTEDKKIHVTVKCVRCQKQLLGDKCSSSNFVSHLKRKHPEAMAVYEASKTKKRQKKKSHSANSKNVVSKRPSRDAFLTSVSKFIIHSLVPLRVVENPYFTSMFDGFASVPSRRTVGRKIEMMFKEYATSVVDEIKEVSYVCTTADIWSCRKRSFLGVTAHWINKDCERVSKALACRRFKGVHSHDRIASMMEQIHTAFGITQEKLVGTTTDNASNFVKAFKEFGVDCETFQEHEQHLGVTVTTVDEIGDEVEVQLTDTDDDTSSSAGSSSEEEDVPNSVWSGLSAHLRCGSHTMNLMGTTDFLTILRMHPRLESIHKDVLNKCNQLWRAAQRPKSAEVIFAILGHTLSRPGETRWNSLHDAISQIVSCREKIPQLCRALGMKVGFKDHEFTYMEEFIEIYEPLCLALDILQGGKLTFYGILLPTLFQLKKTWTDMLTRNWTYGQPLVEGAIASLHKRFNNLLVLQGPSATDESKRAAVATLVHPQFKLDWLNLLVEPNNDDVDDIRQLLMSYLRTAGQKELACETMTVCRGSVEKGATQKRGSSFDRFFKMRKAGESSTQESRMKLSWEKEMSDFMAEETEETEATINGTLNRFPTIKKIFRNFNTPLPSSAPVERLFSFASLVNTPRAHRLRDMMFERRVVLKSSLQK